MHKGLDSCHLQIQLEIVHGVIECSKTTGTRTIKMNFKWINRNDSKDKM